MITAIIIDLLVGDPRSIPHPVIGIGKIISATEAALRKCGTGRTLEKALGVLLVLIVLSAV
ncbi:cobalamin biosynthesis protein, partial [Paenibacillus durus]|uniref:cobalamin biosynthesis protein n=1 Tax=Paenibacillus durus TaxID=44251 RepID=UPI00138AF9AD